MDESTGSAVLAAVAEDVARLWEEVTRRSDLTVEGAEAVVRDGVLAIGARVLEAGLAVRGTGKAGAHRPCPCGAAAGFEGDRPKAVQTLVGWITIRRADSHGAGCRVGHCPLAAALGLARDSLSPGVRRLACRFGAQLPFAAAAEDLAEAARVHLSASTVRTITEAVGTRQEVALAAAIAAAWAQGLPLATEPPPARLDVALDGVRMLGTDGAGREVKVGVVVPVHQPARGEHRAEAIYAAGLEPSTRFGPRLALEAHRRGVEGAGQIAVLGDGAEWIWHLAAEHFPHATQIVDWFHASERVRTLGRALSGEGTDQTTAWVESQLGRLAHGQAATLASEWHQVPCLGAVAAVRDAQVTDHQPSTPHGVRALPGGRLGYRLGHGRERVQAPHRRPRERPGDALERGRGAVRGRRARPAVQ